MLKNLTVRVSDEAARWARRKAAKENTSVSRLVGRMLENEMGMSNEYWRIPGISAAAGFSREELMRGGGRFR